MAKKQTSTSSWELFKEAMDETLSAKAMSIMLAMDDEDYMRNYFKMLEFVRPKMTRTELIDENDNITTLTVKHINSEEDEEQED